jgi:hypothetical protein
MSAIGHFYEENGVMHLTAKLTDFFPAHTRCFARPAEMYEELMGLRSVPYDRALELCDESETVSLPGDLREWSKIVLCGPSELRYQVRFTVFAEPQGPILDYCVAGPFTSAAFASKHGVRYESTEQLVEALDCTGLPSKEICSFTDKIYSVTGPQLRVLGFGMPTI